MLLCGVANASLNRFHPLTEMQTGPKKKPKFSPEPAIYDPASCPVVHIEILLKFLMTREEQGSLVAQL